MDEQDRELTAKERASIASKAQAAAHRELRERYRDFYQDAYQRAKNRLVAELLDRRKQG